MNFSNQFSDSWNSKFPSVIHCPLMDCLKADHFGSLLEQKQALEFEQSKRCAVIDELKQQINQENFIVEFIHKCLQKLSAVSQVFSELDQCDSKSSSSSSATCRRPSSNDSPPTTLNGSVSHGNKLLSSSNSSFSIFPHCIASSLMHSASPLFAAAAAAGPTSPFLLPSTLPQFSCKDAIKFDPDQELTAGRPSNFLLTGSNDRSSYDALSRLAGPAVYNNTNPFSAASNFSAHSLRSQNNSFEHRDDGQYTADHHNSLAATSEAHAQAAAAVAAAFGLGLSTVRSRATPTSHFSPFQKTDNLLSTNDSFPGSSSLHSSPLGGLNGKDSLVDSSVERPYQCSTCFRSFAVKAGLVQHMRTHTDERPYPCLHCGRAFKQKIQLTTHMRVHSGERPYGCRLCGKLFRQQSHVVQHLRTHTGEKPHKCYQCGKAFRQKYSLISHQRRMCRNRAASNPIAAGMTMWISPGAGGDTCNLVKEFSPARSAATTAVTSLSSPNRCASSPISATRSAHSPLSPYMTPSPGNAVSLCQSTSRRYQDFSNRPDDSEGFTNGQHSHSSYTGVSSSRTSKFCRKQDISESLPKLTAGSTHLESDVEEEEDDEEYDENVDDMQNNVRPSSSARLQPPPPPPPSSASQNSTTLGLAR